MAPKTTPTGFPFPDGSNLTIQTILTIEGVQALERA